MEMLELILEEEAEAAQNTVDRRIHEITDEMISRGLLQSSARLKLTVAMFGEVVADLTDTMFTRADALAEARGLPIDEVRQTAARHVRNFLATIEHLVRRAISSCGMANSTMSHPLADGAYAEICKRFERSARLYQEGVFNVGKGGGTGGDNIVTVSGTGNTVTAAQASRQVNQSVTIKIEQLDRLAAAVDEQPLSASARREVEGIIAELRTELAKPEPAREKGKIAGLLDGASKVVGIAQGVASPDVVEAFHQLTKWTGLSV